MGSSNQSSGTSTSSNPGSAAAAARYNSLYGGLAPTNPAVTQANNAANSFYTNYTNAVNQNTADYSNIMGQYGNAATGISNIAIPNLPTVTAQTVVAPTNADETAASGNLNTAAGEFQNFATTGGYSAQDLADLRARGLSPVTATYGNAQANIERAKALGSGYSPNYNATVANLTRGQSQAASDATQAVNANIAQMVQSGKLAGTQGLAAVGGEQGQLGTTMAGQQLQASLANAANNLEAQGMNAQDAIATVNAEFSKAGLGLSAIGGQSSLYGTTPGMASTFGNQALSALSQSLQAQGMNASQAAQLISLMQGNQTQTSNQQSGPSWWQYLLQAAPYIAAPFTGGASLIAAPLINSYLDDGSGTSNQYTGGSGDPALPVGTGAMG